MKIQPNRRAHHESLKQYHARLKKERKWIDNHLKGRVVWFSLRGGAYINAKHGDL